MHASFLLPLSLVLLCFSLLSTPAQSATYTVLIGWETLTDQYGPAWYSLYFYPAQLTIAYGDSVTWVWNSGEVHNVVFSNGTAVGDTNADGTLAPISGLVGNQTHFTNYAALYSSGIRNKNTPPVTLTFLPNTGSGNFSYYCSIHTGMVGVISVLPAGVAAPLTPAAVNASTAATLVSLEAMANAEITSMMAAGPKTGPGVTHITLPDGTTQWTVVMGAMWMNPIGLAMYARFLPAYLEVHVNDTVQFITYGDDPHVVYLNQSNVFQYIYTNWSPTQSTPLNTTLNRINPTYILAPLAFNSLGMPIPVTGTWPNAQGQFYGGLVFDAMIPGVPFPNATLVKFVAPGTFPYICSLHLDVGMIANIVVKPANTPLCTNASLLSTCALLNAVTAVTGDPQFVGLRGQTFQVHGIDGAVYALISTPQMQLNSRFTFLSGPRGCPTLRHQWSTSSRPQPISCWSHDGSYLSELGLSTSTSRLSIVAGTAKAGFQSILLNDSPVLSTSSDSSSSPSSSSSSSSDIQVTVHSTHHLTVVSGVWTLHVENSDGFVNIAGLEVDAELDALDAHGLLGQTSRRRVKGSIEGEVDDYLLADNDIFGSAFLYNRFQAQNM